MSQSRRFSLIRPTTVALLLVLMVSLLAPLGFGRAALAEGTAIATVTTPKLNVRAGAGPGYAVVTTIDQGTVVTLLGRNANSSWAKVQLADATEGWCSTYYLSTTTTWSSLPIINEPDQPSEPTGFVNTPVVNVRSGPGADYSIVMVLGQGHVVGLVGRDVSSSWLQVRVNGVLAWVDSTYIDSSVTVGSLPVTSANVPPSSAGDGTSSSDSEEPVGPPGTAVVLAARLNVRDGAGPGYAVVTTVSGGNHVVVMGRNADGSWLMVKLANGQQGWVSANYVKLLVAAEDIPVLAEVEPTGVITTGTANIRSGPGLDYDVVVTADYGTLVNLLARNFNGSWLKVRVNGEIGWVAASSVTTGYQTVYLPVATGQ